MREVVAPKSFQHRLKVFLQKHPDFETRVEWVLGALQKDPFAPGLKTHRLSGKMKQFYGCSIDYHYRLVFAFDDRAVYLLNIGTHDEVY